MGETTCEVINSYVSAFGCLQLTSYVKVKMLVHSVDLEECKGE